LFVRPRDPEREVWDGARAGVDGAVKDFGANAAFPIAELATKLPELLEGAPRIFYRLGENRKFDDTLLASMERARRKGSRLGGIYPTSIVDIAETVHEARLRKSDFELEQMAKAIDITREAHVTAMARTKPGMYEFEVDSVLRETFRRRGGERVAYESIVGSGPNATVLHYRKNDRLMEDGELLLIDAGTEYNYYASDITRTFPVNGKFSEAQRAVYEVVLDAQLASIEATRPGATLEQIHNAAVEVIARGLIDLGIIAGPVEDALREQRYKPYYMHRTSHYLGMDVHDVGNYFVNGKARELEPRMVITVEPGIYISRDATTVDAKYRGIGVRIEDDVLVSDTGPVVMSKAIPKTVSDVESACRG
jgi:Xaa-Pro aminopeptidase